MSFYFLTTHIDAQNPTARDVAVDTRNATIKFNSSFPSTGEESAWITFLDTDEGGGKLKRADGTGVTLEVFQIAASEALKTGGTTNLTRKNVSDIRTAYLLDEKL